MKTLITTFAFAVMVFAFNTSPASAESGTYYCIGLPEWINYGDCAEDSAELDQLQDPDQADNERAVADSGDEGSTSAASADDQ